MWLFISILCVIMMYLICLTLKNMNELMNQQLIQIKKIMNDRGTIVYKHDKINELLFRKK